MKIKTLLTILCVCFSINLHSQEDKIIYTDFEPDMVLRIPYYAYLSDAYFDINNDNTYDFRLNYDNLPGPVMWFKIKLCKDGIVDEFQIYPVYDWEQNDSISTNQPLQWGAYYDIYQDYGEEYSYIHSIDYDIVLRTNMGDGNYCYGWIRLCLTARSGAGEPFATIYDMAYCTVPNYPLRVGQKSFDDTSINGTSEFKDYVLFPSPANDKITLKFNNHYYNTTDNEIKIYGIDGRLLKTQNSDFDNIDISNLTSGVYIMKIYLGNGENYTEKFMKE